MRNLEGIKKMEIPENKMEQESTRVSDTFDPDNFDDCARDNQVEVQDKDDYEDCCKK